MFYSSCSYPITKIFLYFFYFAIKKEKASQKDIETVEEIKKYLEQADLDDDIELPDQTLNDVYFLRQIRPMEAPKPWMSYYGEMPEDT